MDKIKIGCLTYKMLDSLTRNAIVKLNDPMVEIIVFEGLMEDLIEKVRDAHKEGVDVFVGGGANAGVIRKTTGATVVSIRLRSWDYLEAILKGKMYGNRIGIVSYKNMPDSMPEMNLKRIETFLGVEIEFITFEEADELEARLLSSELDVVIGASLTNEIAKKIRIPSVLIYPGEGAILAAVKEAKQLGIAIQNERNKSKIIEAIMNFTPSGIVATDKNGDILMFNPAAEKIFNKSSSKTKGIHYSKVLPELELDKVLLNRQPDFGVVAVLENSEVVINRVPIETSGHLIGTVATVTKVSEIQKAEQKIRFLNQERGFSAKAQFHDIIGNSKVLKQISEKAKSYAKTDSNILIYGETGVGKEIFAQSIHNYSYRQKGPFIAINCAALPESLLESELFGYEEGAFTGSRKGGKCGLFEMAHGGTIFLDEIGEISPSLQSRLLRVLQEREVMRIGGDRVISVDIRIIAATNKNLEERVPQNFRADLFYRLNVLQLNIPPLRERDNDVIELFKYLLKRYLDISNDDHKISAENYELLKYYSWPGNIRELQNVTERFAIHLQSETFLKNASVHELLLEAIGEDRLFNDLLQQYGLPLNEKIGSKQISKPLLEKLMQVFPGQKNKIASKLGVSRTTLWRNLSE